MKTSLRIHTITMSLVALVVFGFASTTIAKSFPFQKIEWKNSDGTVTSASVDENGHFKTPALKAGSYTYSWSLISRPMGSNAAVFGVGRGISSPTGGSADRESSAPSVSEVVVSYEIQAPRDVATGLPTGKRMHKPFVITKELDRSTPLLSTALGVADVDVDCDGITGTVSFKSSSGQSMKVGWDIKAQAK